MEDTISFDAILFTLCGPIPTSMILTRACEEGGKEKLIEYESLLVIRVFLPTKSSKAIEVLT